VTVIQPVTADEEADGEHTVTVTIGDTERVVPVTVEEPEDPLERGEVGQLVFTARTTDGRLVVSNDANVTDAGYPETAVFRAMGTSGAVPVPLQEGGQFPAELVDVATGVGIGHSITVPVGELFGGEIVEDTQPRETSVPRELTVPVETSYGARQAQQVLDRDTQEGDEVDLPQEGFRVPYTVETIGQREVTFQLAVEVNETFTLVEPWTDAARVTNTTDGQATIDHDPDVAEGDQLTWVDAWGNVTEVVAVDESIQLRHSPPVGLTYERTDPRSGQTISNEIVELTDDEVRIEQTNPHPLAGEPIIFDVTVIDRGQEGPRTQGPR
jgi:FKBP-type peptidyl-prolyl cis-trans isomerase 2